MPETVHRDAKSLLWQGVALRDGAPDRSGRPARDPDPRGARACFRKAAELGHAGAMDELASSLTESRPSPSSRAFTEAVGWYRKAYARGETTAACNLAVTYLNAGLHRLAVLWFRRAVAAGDFSAELELAQAELLGLGTRRAVSTAVKRLESFCQRSDQSAYDQESAWLILAQAYLQGWLVRRDYPAGVAWLRHAAERGSAAAKGLLQDLGEPT